MHGNFPPSDNTSTRSVLEVLNLDNAVPDSDFIRDY